MKKIRLLMVGLALCLTLAVVPVGAQEGGGIVSPVQLSVSAVRGHVRTRILLLRPVQPLENVRIVPLDLVGAEGKAVLPGSVIHVDLPDSRVAANSLMTIPVRFDFNDVPSGEFSGELLVSYDGGHFSVPVRVAVKDQPWFALVALVAGVALGVGVSTYRAQGRPRDDILVRLGQIRTQMKVDKALLEVGKPFYDRLEAELVDVEVALEGQRWEEAHAGLEEAGGVWRLWRRGRPDWLEQLGYYTYLKAKLVELGEDIFFVGELVRSVNDAYRAIPDMEGPDVFRAGLQRQAKHVNEFVTLAARIDTLANMDAYGRRAMPAQVLRQRLYTLNPNEAELYATHYEQLQQDVDAAMVEAQRAQVKAKISKLKDMCERLPEPEQQATWMAEAEALEAHLVNMEDVTPAAYLALAGEVETVMERVEDLLPDYEMRSGAMESFAVKSVGAASLEQPRLLNRSPNIQIQSLSEQIVGAGRRLRWFTWLTYIIAVVFLALAGFVELYSARPDFGANGIADYFTLLAWGFGAEATRSAVADMVQGWGISPAQ